MSSLTDIITRNYSNFRGVDFSNNDVILSRSPNAKNMWINYENSKCIQTRPGMTLLDNFGNSILGLFFFEKNNVMHVLVHSGTKIFKWTNYPTIPAQTLELYTGMNVTESKSFIFNNTLFIMDGVNYLEYNGTTITSVIGTIPTTSYYKNPDGSTNIDETTDNDLVYQDVNCLTSWRKNVFIGDGTSTNYQLDTTNLDSAASSNLVTATINGTFKTENIDFSVNRITGVVAFNNAPAKNSEVIITFSKTGAGYRDRILNCTLMCEFDNRIFFSGNPDYPNAVFHSELNDPRYIRDTAFYDCGLDLAPIKAIIPGNNVLWVLKAMNQNSSSVFYMTPTLDSTYGKIYPSVNGSISLGCISTGINFNDDIVFFSNKGLEGVSNSSLYSEQILGHRSSLIDTKLLQENGYSNVKLAEYKGYLMCLVNSHIYLADSRQKFQNNTDIEYEWFYWELPNTITFIKEYRGNIYLGNTSGNLYIMNGTSDVNSNIESVWTTAKDNFGYPSYTKTTNKRGNNVELLNKNNNNIKLDTIVDGILKEKTTLSDTNSIVPFRIKDKKFKEIQLKISSNSPFGLFSCTIQGFVAGYIKK